MPTGHRTAELRSLEYHRLVAGRLDDAAIERARDQATRLPPEARDAWLELLDGPREALARTLAEDTQTMRDLRQNTPFAGLVAPAERWRIIRDVQ